jgi:hypothetical protein
VAERAGIGVDWYVRLEQGRAEGPSTTTIDALARALCLDPAEHSHLRALARLPARRAFRRETVPGTICSIVASLRQPAYVTGARWDVLAWIRAATRAITDFARIKEEDRNILLFVLTAPAARPPFGAEWAAIARRMVLSSEPRMTSGLAIPPSPGSSSASPAAAGNSHAGGMHMTWVRRALGGRYCTARTVLFPWCMRASSRTTSPRCAW